MHLTMEIPSLKYVTIAIQLAMYTLLTAQAFQL